MNKEEFLGKLQMCYFGERNAFDEIVSEFDRLNNIIDELEKIWKEQQEHYRYVKDNRYRRFLSKSLDKLKELKEQNER